MASVASCRIPSSGSPTNMPSTSGTRAIDAAAAVEACGPKQNIGAPYFALDLRDRVDVRIERRRGARKDDQRRREALAFEPRDDVRNRQPLRGRVDQPDIASGIAQQRARKRERVRRLGRAEHVLALLAAALARKGDTVDERRVDEQRLPPEHLCRHHRTTVRGIARRAGRGTPAPKGSASATGESSTLQQRRQTGKMPFSTRRFLIST